MNYKRDMNQIIDAETAPLAKELYRELKKTGDQYGSDFDGGVVTVLYDSNSRNYTLLKGIENKEFHDACDTLVENPHNVAITTRELEDIYSTSKTKGHSFAENQLKERLVDDVTHRVNLVNYNQFQQEVFQGIKEVSGGKSLNNETGVDILYPKIIEKAQQKQHVPNNITTRKSMKQEFSL